MYFDGTTLIALIADPDRAAAALVGGHRRFTSPLAVIEVLASTPDAGVTEFLDAQGIELRDMPPGHRLVEFARAQGGADVAALLHGACAAYYEAEVFTLPPQG